MGWNREHLWCNNYGLDDVQPAYSDLHNLRACDANVNSSRGNKFYDTTATNSTGYAFPAHPEAPLCSTDLDSWEPLPSDRGNIARSLFYMAIRYTGDVANEPALVLTDNTALINSASGYMGNRRGALPQAGARVDSDQGASPGGNWTGNRAGRKRSRR